MEAEKLGVNYFNMARPERNNVDYFPFICEDGNKMFYIEETYGNDGFATFVKLLRELAKTNYHYLDLSKPTTVMFSNNKPVNLGIGGVMQTQFALSVFLKQVNQVE